jgi:hypothetical protein
MMIAPSMLSQGNRPYNRRIRSIDPSQGVVAYPEIYAAEAGGLEPSNSRATKAVVSR